MSYQVCKTCVMDTSDPGITFDAAGICNYCNRLSTRIIGRRWFPNENYDRFWPIVEKIKAEGRNKEYDCMIGLSGGVDSTYVAYLTVRIFGLRPLALHVDSGWNSEIAVANIENTIRNLNIPLFTYVVDWDEMQDLQRAYLRAGVVNLDVPQDHAFRNIQVRVAKTFKLTHFLHGSNYATESILPNAWGYRNSDAVNLKAIHKTYGQRRLRRYPLSSTIDMYFSKAYKQLIQKHTPLNYGPYSRSGAVTTISRELGWRDYGGKHYESRWTKWFQGFYLQQRFGFDKRRAHYASLVAAGELTRDQALSQLQAPPYDPIELAIDHEYVFNKLDMREEDFFASLNQPLKYHEEFPTDLPFRNTQRRFKDYALPILIGRYSLR